MSSKEALEYGVIDNIIGLKVSEPKVINRKNKEITKKPARTS
jgi:ATP-dependent protease ClpP protease subunit